ncbi:2-dehydro-3-deoxygluconokinase [Thalassocella blandensis]|nr:2-dehydro-3-deoxygluconokinase [Thalassocella blandensis]
MKKIALIGEAMIELHGKMFGSMQQTYGGDVINTTVYLARLLHYFRLQNEYFHIDEKSGEPPEEHSQNIPRTEVYFVSAVGRDILSQQLLLKWQHEHVNTNLVLQQDGKSPGLYMIQLDENGERSFQYWRQDSAARYMFQHSHISIVASRLAQMDSIYISGISLAILSEPDRQSCLQMLKDLHAAGVKIFFDSNYRAILWDSRERCQYYCQELYALSFMVMATEQDERAIWQACDEIDLIERIHRAGAPHVVIKRGKDGCLASLDAGKAPPRSISVADIAVVDSTAAGDAFNAGIMAGHLMQWDWQDAIALANALAAEVIQHHGAIVPVNAIQQFCRQYRPHSLFHFSS